MLEIDSKLVKEEQQLMSGEKLILLKDSSCRTIVQSWIENGRDVHLSSVVGIDNIDSLQVFYYFMDRSDNSTLAIAVDLNIENPTTDSIGDLLGSAVYEGEATEMFGIKFEGNEIANVFLPENWVGGYPLRKSWKKEDYFND